MLIALFGALALADDAWLIQDVDLLRWPDPSESREVVVAEGLTGDKVEILFRDTDLIRVRKGGDFGWVPASALTETAPEDTAAEAP